MTKTSEPGTLAASYLHEETWVSLAEPDPGELQPRGSTWATSEDIDCIPRVGVCPILAWIMDHECPLSGVVTDEHAMRGDLLLVIPFREVIRARAATVRSERDLLSAEPLWGDLLLPASRRAKWVSSGYTTCCFPGNVGLWESKLHNGFQGRLLYHRRHPGTSTRIGAFKQVLITGIVDNHLLVDEEACVQQAWGEFVAKLQVFGRGENLISGTIDGERDNDWIVCIGENSFPAILRKTSLNPLLSAMVKTGYLLTELMVIAKDDTPGNLSVVLEPTIKTGTVAGS